MSDIQNTPMSENSLFGVLPVVKRCRKCGKVKSIEEFNLYKAKRNVRSHRHCYCKPCRLEITRECRRRCKDLYGRSDRKKRLRLYGISEKTYYEMVEKQNGLCAICKKPQTNKRLKNLAVDHDHASGCVRELLCTKCNFMIAHAGQNGDDISILEAGIIYLRRHGKD